MRRLITSLFAFAGILSGRIASPDYEDVEFITAAEDAIDAADCFLRTWKDRGRPRAGRPRSPRIDVDKYLADLEVKGPR